MNRAAALLRLERREDAEQACDAALKLQPENVKALYRRGVARAENPIKAIEDLKRALQLEPGNTAAKRELAKAERRRAEREREEQRKMKQGLRKAASLSLYGDKEAEKREARDKTPAASSFAGWRRSLGDGRRAYLVRVLRAVAMPPRRIAFKPQAWPKQRKIGARRGAERCVRAGQPSARDASLATILSVKAV